MRYKDLAIGKAVVFLPWENPCVVLSVRSKWHQRLRDRRRGYRPILLGWPGNNNTVACGLAEIGPCADEEVAESIRERRPT